MKIYLTKRVEFCAGHRLSSPRLSAEENRALFGKCSNPQGHGHNYLLEVTVCGEPDPTTGMVMNLSQLKEILELRIVAVLDHRDLNRDEAILKGRVPTAENLAVAIWECLQNHLPAGRLHEVKIWETEDNCAAYRGEA
ncbi:MAG: 6-carboxytetrahydropterin synthase [candidate division FCPU426 bacterium]